MTDIERIVRIMRTEGLNLDTTQAAEHLASIGYADTWPDDAVRTHLHAYSSRQGAAQVDLNLPAALRDPGFRASLGRLGDVAEWNKLSTTNKNLLLQRYAADQARASGQTPLQSFEREMVQRYGSGFRTSMSGIEKTRYADLCDTRPKVGVTTMHTMHADLVNLRNKLATAVGMDRVNLSTMVANLERRLGVGKAA